MFGFVKAARMGRLHRHGIGGPFGPFAGSWPGERRARRGDIKYSILEVLADRPAHGYDVIKELEARREGHRPSAGSVYPTLQMLEDAGYVEAQMLEGKRVFSITEAGRTFLAERTRDPAAEEDVDDHLDLKSSAMKLAAAVIAAAREHDPSLNKRVRDIIDRARKEIYTLLSESQS